MKLLGLEMPPWIPSGSDSSILLIPDDNPTDAIEEVNAL